MSDYRKQFAEEFGEISKDERVCLLTCDVGFHQLEEIGKEMGDRFVNTGITEPATMGMAAGLAREGMIPYVYSMIPFVTFRCHEVIRDLIAMPALNVKIVGVSGSEAYQMLGWSHNMVDPHEDAYMMAGLKNFMIYIPRCEDSARELTKITYEREGPSYLRL